MLLDRYEKEQLLFNMNFKEATTTAGAAAYRGELVLIEGEIGDAQGRRKPPHAVLRHASVLVEGEKIAFLSGALDDILNLKDLLARYQPDCKPGAILILFVVNIPQELIVEEAGMRLFLIPMQDGMAWTELCERLGLEKGDFKGQSAADKVLTVFKAVGDFKPKFSGATLAEALASRNDAKREARGPV
jgi:hypothetical protein